MRPEEFHFQAGDLAACFGGDVTSRLVSGLTSSLIAPRGLRFGPSHVAMFCRHQRNLLWVESTTLTNRPCFVQGRTAHGVQAHIPADRIRDYCGSGGRVDLYRLIDFELLSVAEDRLLTQLLIDRCIGRSLRYDLTGALFSGTRLFQLSRLFPGADLDRLFCSELVAAVLMRLGRLGRDNPTRFHPARLIRRLVRNGTYRRVATWHREAC